MMENLTMNRSLLAAVGIAAIMSSTVAGAAGDPAAGQKKAQVCASCHGPDGVSPTPNFPILAGQYSDYLVHALKQYKSGERENAVMKGFAVGLSEQDMWDLAAWFASQGGLTAPRIKNP